MKYKALICVQIAYKASTKVNTILQYLASIGWSLMLQLQHICRESKEFNDLYEQSDSDDVAHTH